MNSDSRTAHTSQFDLDFQQLATRETLLRHWYD